MRLIDADAIVYECNKAVIRTGDCFIRKCDIEREPTIEVEPKPMHWIDTAECRFKYSMDSRFRCSVCGKGYDFKHRFCPNCGKKADNPLGVILKVKMGEVEE